MDLLPVLEKVIEKSISELYQIKKVLFIVEHPERLEYGDFSTNAAMVLGKLLKQPPIEVAKNLSYKIKEVLDKTPEFALYTNTFISIQEVLPGFINFVLSDYWLNNLPNTMLSTDHTYGAIASPVQKRIALEHSNVNPNKAAHVGHLRNACVGQFIERAYKVMGNKTEVQYYCNNIGVQVATSAMGLDKVEKGEIKLEKSPTSYEKFDHYVWDVYSRMESLIAASEALQAERNEILKKLEDPNSPEFIKQKKLGDKILQDQLKTFAKLDIDYDIVIFESDVIGNKFWEKSFERLKQNPHVYLATEGKSKGCWLVKMDGKHNDTAANSTEDQENQIEADKIIVRSNGVPTYTGKDIAYHMWKFGLLGLDFGYEKLNFETQAKTLYGTTTDLSPSNSQNKAITFSGVDRVFDVIGSEQTYAMDVVKKSLGYLGYEKQAENMRHINYGFVYLSLKTANKLGIDTSDNKKFYPMSGRKGWGVKIDDLIDMMDQKLTTDYGNFENIQSVRNGAIKFSMLKLNTFQDLIFDLDEALDVKGYTGPYIQYAYVRANSVLSKVSEFNEKSIKVDEFSNFQADQKETDILRWIYRFPEIVKQSAELFAPNQLCDFLYELAKKYNSMYNELPIIKAKDEQTKKFRLAISLSVKNVLSDGLWLLGIQAPSRM